MAIYTNPNSKRKIFNSAITVRCTEEQREEWANEAESRGVSLNALVRMAMFSYVTGFRGRIHEEK